jgi:hypothetical protein
MGISIEIQIYAVCFIKRGSLKGVKFISFLTGFTVRFKASNNWSFYFIIGNQTGLSTADLSEFHFDFPLLISNVEEENAPL